MITLSIIIPVYNAELYLKRCLASIFNQREFDFEFEVLAVNDGSKDNSLIVLRELQSIYKDLIIFDQDNAGAGSARNVGIENARGKFIWFIDSDDYIEPNSFSVIQKKCLADESKDSTFGFNYYRVDGESKFYPDNDIDHKDFEIFNGLEYVEANSKKPYYLWVIIYNRKIIDEYNLRFIEGIKNLEDLEFSLRYFNRCKNIKYINQRLYNYFENNNSTSRNKSRTNLDKIALDSQVVHYSLKRNSLGTERSTIFNEVLDKSIIGFFYSLYKFNYSYTDLKKYYVSYRSENLLPTKIINKNFKYTIFEFIVNSKFIYLTLSFVKKKILHK